MARSQKLRFLAVIFAVAMLSHAAEARPFGDVSADPVMPVGVYTDGGIKNFLAITETESSGDKEFGGVFAIDGRHGHFGKFFSYQCYDKDPNLTALIMRGEVRCIYFINNGFKFVDTGRKFTCMDCKKIRLIIKQIK
ncbi:hypothetical protein [Jiella marina]|uniref:hypothetical protein n=1 Tax=Jiella sp. LLJ827 TaxID=2917712 RepID=UPI00210097C4|nr:hypothetical protein [Jiella sp. LLJ827]MCQ0990620.1 hypothetical protein [Jiella sp. LLJ827]